MSDPSRTASPEHLALLAALGTQRHYRDGEMIIRQAEPSTFVVVLLEGTTKVVRDSGDGTETILGLRQAPEILGEMAALDGGLRSASVVALTEVEAALVSADAFRRFLAQRPAMASAVMATIVERLRESDRARLEAATWPVARRVAARLIELAPRIGTESATGVRLQLSQQELAGWAGASREAVVRTLRLLRDQGVVATERGQIIITNRNALAAMAVDAEP